MSVWWRRKRIWRREKRMRRGVEGTGSLMRRVMRCTRRSASVRGSDRKAMNDTLIGEGGVAEILDYVRCSSLSRRRLMSLRIWPQPRESVLRLPPEVRIESDNGVKEALKEIRGEK